MTHAFVTASTSPVSSRARRYPMTTAARLGLEADIARLATDARTHVHEDQGEQVDGTPPLPRMSPAFRARERLERMRETFADAEVVDVPGVVVIGRRFTLRDGDGMPVTYGLVPPGEGAPTEGRIAVDSPLGAAVLGRRVGDPVEVDAPSGRRAIAIEWIG